MRTLEAHDNTGRRITARILDDVENGRGGLIRFTGWLNDEPALFLHRPALDRDTMAVVPMSRLFLFTTPGSMASLYTGDAPLDPVLAAAACAEACRQLEWELSPGNLSAILDTVQDGADSIIKMPNWSATTDAQKVTKWAEVDVLLNGEVVETRTVEGTDA